MIEVPCTPNQMLLFHLAIHPDGMDDNASGGIYSPSENLKIWKSMKSAGLCRFGLPVMTRDTSNKKAGRI